ncbi:UPF0764 protein C16orf89 homolog [Takifugu rubripes]|uniref:Chromosome 16 open reading frame 89 n=1 Tax=Takifugu rubripes TaxID=31033 RepID=H2RLM2_TAKRU|nr:UPF0764 protein C16orf89 homolog [Takifugu rubripes]|eukprot:XP_003965018.1 PREDICTED: UPF0764 protein C16orf89 homolog [Takifugu rubripes]
MRAAGHQVAAALLLFAAVFGTRAEVIDDILGSLTDAVSFLEREREQVNLDGLVGFIMLQAVLKDAVQTWPHSDPVSWAQRATTVALIRRLDRSTVKAMDAIKQSDPQYFREFEPLLSWGFWVIPHEWTSTDVSLFYSNTRKTECFDEQRGDKCMKLLLGTWKVNGTPCIATKSCLDTMTNLGCRDYSLSHQLLYFLIGKMKGCTSMLKGYARASQANMTERGYERIYCSNMMKINQDIFRDSLKETRIDIFMENILFCGLAGFSDFFKPDWLQWIIQRQDKDLGCFGRDENITSLMAVEKLLEQPHPSPSRVKRREKVLPDGCSSHTTSVAVGTLGGFLGFYLTEQDITKRPLS